MQRGFTLCKNWVIFYFKTLLASGYLVGIMIFWRKNADRLYIDIFKSPQALIKLLNKLSNVGLLLVKGASMCIVEKTTGFYKKLGVHSSWYCWETLEWVRLYKIDFVNFRL